MENDKPLALDSDAEREHYISARAGGEKCGMCFREGRSIDALHKVGEEGLTTGPIRHNLTQYLCCQHFGEVFGPPSAERWTGCDPHILLGLASEQSRGSEGVESVRPGAVLVCVGELLFEFSSFNDWVRHAQLWFRDAGHTSGSTLCVDSHGLICTRGKMFSIAHYPIYVYAIDDPPFTPQGMLGRRQRVAVEESPSDGPQTPGEANTKGAGGSKSSDEESANR